MSYSIKETVGAGGITLYEITYKNFTALGSAVRLPQSDIFILTVVCGKGLLLCRLYDCAVAEKLGAAAAIFSAATLEDVLKNKPHSLTAQAEALGATLEMTGLEILERLS